MNIAICGSVTFLDEMNALAKDLKKMGFATVHTPTRPPNLKPLTKGHKSRTGEGKDPDYEEDARYKIEFDLIRKYWHKILDSDCILVANYDKKGIPGYIGGNSFLEMGFAFVTGKPIFLLNPWSEISYESEIEGMKPIVIDNDLSKIAIYYISTLNHGTYIPKDKGSC